MRIMAKLVVAVAVLSFLVSGAVYAASSGTPGAAGQKKAAVVDAGNAICPVTGDKISGKDFYEYKGKRYGLCCPMCVATFAGDPEKYAAIVDKEVAGKK